MVAVMMGVGVVVLLGVAGVGLVIVLLVVVGGEEVIGIVVVVVGLVVKVLVLGEYLPQGRVLLLSRGLRSEKERETEGETYHLNLCLHMNSPQSCTCRPTVQQGCPTSRPVHAKSVQVDRKTFQPKKCSSDI